MAAITKLQSILGDEFATIKPELAIKIEDFIKSQHNEINEFKFQINQLTASTEQHSFQLEKELQGSQNKLSETIHSCDTLKTQLAEIEEKLKESLSKNEDLKENHQKAVVDLQNLQCSITNLNNDKIQLSDLLGKKEIDNQKLNELVHTLRKEVEEANASSNKFLVKAEDLEIKIINIQHSNRKLEQEKSLLQQQVSSLNDELSQKSNEILRLRKEKSSKILELQSELEEKLDEVRIAQDFVSNFKKQIAEKDKNLSTLALKNKEVQDSSLLMEQQYKQEIQALTKLRDLHKKNSEGNQEKVSELVKTIEEMHKLLKETGESNSVLEKSINETQDDWQSKLEEKNEEIERLNKQLSLINELLTKSKVLGFTEDGVESMFPNAAATSKVLKSEMTLTEIYSELVKAQTDVQTERFEKQKLHQQLKQILDEIEEKTPLFNKKLQEYQNALETITCLRNQLGISLMDQERLQSERDNSVRKVQYLERESERMNSIISDLSLQVRNLLREIEEAKGGRITDPSQIIASGGSDATTVITQHLVTFKDVNELQEKNQQLLAVVRDLSNQLEENEKKNLDKSSLELKTHLDEALKQLDELQDERKHQITLVESIVRQKDLYKSMVSQFNLGQSMDSFTSSTEIGTGFTFRKSHDNSEISVEEVQGTMKQLQEEFDNYRKEKQLDYLTLTEQLDKFRDELSEARIQNAKLNSELDYVKEKYELAQSKAESYKKEVIIFREKSQKYSTSAIQHQQTISALRQDLISLQEKLAKSESTVQNLQAERELLKATEIRLLQEKEASIREQQSHSRVIANLQVVQNNLERMESDAKLSMQKQIDKIEQEIITYKSKLESEADRYQAAAKAWEAKNEDLQTKLLVEVGKSNKTHEELVEAYSQLHQTKLELATLQSKFSAAQTKLSRMPIGGDGRQNNEVRVLQTQLNETKNEINGLKQKLTLSQKNYEKYQGISNDLEKHMKEETEAARLCKVTLEGALKAKEEEAVKMEAMAKDMEQQNNSLKTEMSKLTNDRDQLMKNMDTLKHELDKSLSLVKQAQKIEHDSQHDKQEQARLVAEAQENYQRELVLHSTDVQELSSLRDKVQGIENNLLAAEEQRDRLKESILSNQQAWDEREKLMKKEMEVMSQKCLDLQVQNEALFQQIEVMSSQLAAIKSSKWANDSTMDVADDNSTEHLMEVIRYLRKEKEIALSQSESTLAECSRYKIKSEILERKITEVEKELKDERERANLIATSENQHRELLKKVEMLNLLSESNKLLRDEKDAAVLKNGVLEARVKQLECQLAPLQKSLQDSTSQMDVVNTECIALRQEVKKWQNRAAQLLEQSRKHDPEDFKKLQEENSNLKTQLNNLTEEKLRLKAELSKQSATLTDVQKELSNLQNVHEQEKQNIGRLEQELGSSKSESAEHLRTNIQVKKIARKYKTEYTELKTQYDDMVTKMNSSGEATVAQAAKEQQMRQEIQQELENKNKEANEKAQKANEEAEKFKEEITKLTKNEENSKAQEERLRRLILQLKKKLTFISTERENLVREKNETAKEVEDIKSKLATLEQSSEEDNLRASTFKSQYESKITKLEKELKTIKDSKDRLEKQMEDLSRQKQSSRPSTSAGLVERASSTISEPPLIRPLTPPMVSSGGPGSLRHPSHSHPTASSARSTPTASIRPMAIGTSSPSPTVVASHASSSSRTATVTPTTAATIPVSEAENMPVTTAHVLPTVPQATVQPTPAVVANISTVTIAPSTSSTNEQMSNEVASTVSESVESVFVSSAVPISRFRQSDLPASQEDSRGGPSEAEDSCSSSVVSVSVVSTSPQTQVVTPTVKRPREEQELQSSVITRETDSPDTTGSTSAPQVKRIRIVGDTAVTIERASVVTSGTSLAVPVEPTIVDGSRPHQMESSSSSGVSRDDHPSTTQPPKPQEEVMPERPGVIVTPEPQTTPATTEANNNQVTPEPETSATSEQVSSNLQYSSSQQSSDGNFTENKNKTAREYSEADESKKSFAECVEQEFEVVDEGDEDEVEEVMDEGGSYEDEEPMPDAEDEDDDMENDYRFEIPDEEIPEQNSDEVEIEDDSQMDAQDVLGGPSSSCHSTVVGDNVPTSTSSQHDLPSAMVTGNTSSSSSVMTTSIGSSSLPTSSENQDVIVPGTITTHHRPTILPRVPPRSERIPSVGRQHLTPFSISGQGGTFEDGDDSIVPSTPTLFVQGRGDGFAEAVSSPQVPHGRFLFTNTSEVSSQPGLSQLATQGGVDDTRMDLSQFDEGSGRSVPTTPLQVSPPADAPGSSDLTDSVPTTQPSLRSQIASGVTDQQVTSTHTIPTIMVTPNDDISLIVSQEETGENREAVTVIEESSVTIDEQKEEDLLILGTSSENATELGSADEGIGSDKETSTTQSNIEGEEGTNDGSGDYSTNKGQPQRKPITWDSTKASTAASNTAPISTTAPSSSSSPSQPLLPFPHPPPRSRGSENIQRGRRLRIRGAGATYSPRGPGQRGNWNYWRGRGRGGPPMP